MKRTLLAVLTGAAIGAGGEKLRSRVQHGSCETDMAARHRGCAEALSGHPGRKEPDGADARAVRDRDPEELAGAPAGPLGSPLRARSVRLPYDSGPPSDALRRSFSSVAAPTLAPSYAERKSLFFNGLLGCGRRCPAFARFRSLRPGRGILEQRANPRRDARGGGAVRDAVIVGDR